MTRRDLLKTGTASLALSGLAGYAAYAQDSKPIRAGLIGAGWYGKIDTLRLLQVAPNTEVVSVCDVDKRMLAEAGQIIASRQQSKKTPRLYGDYREMLKEKDIDVCMVGTPDHWHALPTIAAIEAGADVYVQKPISVDVMEGKAMLDAARKHNRVVQVGTQRRSTPHLIDAVEKVIKPGLLGKVHHVEIHYYFGGRKGRLQEQPVPENLDYEMWAGPAPKRPFTQGLHPRSWRQFMEYGNGTVGDMCIHMLDMVRWMLNLGWPKSVSSTGGIYMFKEASSNIADTQTINFMFDELPVRWTHRAWGENPYPDYPWAAIIYGDKGTLKSSVHKYEFFPLRAKEPTFKGEPLFEYDKFPEDQTERDLERHVSSAVRWHMKDLLKARESRGKPVADIEQGHTSTACCILANISMKLGGRNLVFDPVKHEVVGDAEANGLLKRPYRSPWKHPAEA